MISNFFIVWSKLHFLNRMRCIISDGLIEERPVFEIYMSLCFIFDHQCFFCLVTKIFHPSCYYNIVRTDNVLLCTLSVIILAFDTGDDDDDYFCLETFVAFAIYFFFYNVRISQYSGETPIPFNVFGSKTVHILIIIIILIEHR